MLVLHALPTVAGDLALWAEDSGLPARHRDKGAVAAHPFAVPAEELADRWGAVTGTGAQATIPVLLPSYGSAPAASPALVRDPLATRSGHRGALRLRPWLVPVVRLGPERALSTLDDRLLELPDCRPAASVRYLLAVAALARDLVSQGRVLPSLVRHGNRWAARWRPALSGAASVWFAALRDAMPPACRAEQVDAGLLDGREPTDVLHTLLDAFVDADVRTRLERRSVRLTPQARGRIAAADVTVQAWLRALVGEPEFEADAAPAGALAEQLDAWRASGAQDSAVRTCFRLRSPDQADPGSADDEATWRVEFLLQAVDEPSVLVPAAQVWRERDGVLTRWVAQPQEVLLAGLGRASRTLPELDAALLAAHPVELATDAEGAYRFLDRAAALDQAGFGVLLPSGWRRPGELGLRLTATSTSAAGVVATESALGLQALVDYRWELALGDQSLTSEELDELAAAKVPLVRIRGQWVHIDQKGLAAGLAFLRAAGTGQMPAAQVLARATAQTVDADLPLVTTSVVADGWLGDLLSGQVEQHLEPVEPPESFHGSLRPYQRRGLAWLAFLDRLGLGACLADDMGLGKTVQILALETLARAGGKRNPTLLVCPMSVVGNWQREAATFAPTLSVYVHHGADRLAGAELAKVAAEHDLVITTFALAARDTADLAATTWDRVVLDEAQNIKNSASRQSRAVRALTARHRVALTGTPVENRLAELWSIMDFANPGVLGSVTTFRARFAVPVERHGDEEAAARLRRVTAPFVLRRLKTDPTVIDDLPDKIEMKTLCNLTAEQASLYQAVVDDMLERISDSEGIERKGLVLATMSKLKQVCNHPAQFLGDSSRIAGRSGKLERLEELLDAALADGDKVLCFSQFTEFPGMLVPYLSARLDTEVLFLHGGTTKKARDAMVERFQSADGPSVFLLSLKAGGTGLNLTAANHVVHLDRWWNPAVEDQATDRAFRIGQRRKVQVRKFVCIGTIEEKIDQMIEDKKALAQLVVGSGESWLTDLSTTELRELVSLSSDAVGD